jgi:hypothetical protein
MIYINIFIIHTALTIKNAPNTVVQKLGHHRFQLSTSPAQLGDAAMSWAVAPTTTSVSSSTYSQYIIS